jgi:hypothetical protein
MENKYLGLDKHNLKDDQLRLLNELANYRTDSKRARQRLASARSALAEVRFEMEMLEEAMRLATVLQFPSPSLEVRSDLPVEAPGEAAQPLKTRRSR